MPKRATYIIAYDTPDSNRRATMLDRIAGFGFDPQFSFHECRLSNGERNELWTQLRQCADANLDNLLLLRLDPRNEQWRLGSANNPSPDKTVYYVG